MRSPYLTLTPESLPSCHICCAFSDKKCTEGTALKKAWLTQEYAQGWRFHRLDERAKVFVEYGPAQSAWVPVDAPDAMMIGCFWVSGRYAKHGHGKALLAHVVQAARDAGMGQIVTVTGRRKFHFMSNGAWFKRQGFACVDTTESGFELLSLDLGSAKNARFLPSVCAPPEPETGISVWYSDRCPYTAYHVETALSQACAERDIPLHLHKIDSLEAARAAPAPAVIFALFKEGRFVTTDLSVCLPARLDAALAKL